jgi:hypothetical protein
VAASLGIAAALLWKIPRLQVVRLIQAGVAQEKIAELENSARDTLAKIFGGLFFLGTLYFTWQSVQIERQKELASERGQITERFTRAVDQLGSRDSNVRVGGIYALERIADDSPNDYQWTVTQILAAFVRERAAMKEMTIPPDVSCDKVRPRGTPAQQPAVDIQAALDVIGRRGLEYIPPLFGGPRAVDLRHTDLRGANLSEANLRYAALTDSTLEGASMGGADLQGATLRGADLTCALMRQSKLGGADISGAVLNGAILSDATGLTCDQIGSADTRRDAVLPSYLLTGEGCAGKSR